MSELMEMNTVKYSAYRLALKLRRVQQRLCLDLLDLEAAVLGFDMHGLTPDRHDMAIEVPEMVAVASSSPIHALVMALPGANTSTHVP